MAKSVHSAASQQIITPRMSKFSDAPLTNITLWCGLAATIFLQSNNAIILDVPAIISGEVWRLVFSQFAFENMSQAVVGGILLYNCRQFEKFLGLKKFAAFFVLAYFFSILSQIGCAVTALSLGFKDFIPSSGPYFLIYPLVSLYYAHIPRLYPSKYSILGLDLSEKTFIYVLAGQLMFCDGFHSILPSLVGIVFGQVYDKDSLGLQVCRLPRIVENAGALVYSLASSLFPTPPPAAAAPALRQGPFGQQQFVPAGAGGAGAGAGMMMMNNARPVPALPPSEADITNLMEMLGRDRATVVRALQASGNNVEAAANSLLR